MPRQIWLFLSLAVAVTLVVGVACGGDDDGSSNEEPTPQARVGAAEMSADTTLHHWQALMALKDGDIDDTRDHVQHVLDAVANDATHAEGMRGVLAVLDADNLEEAEHGIETMLAGRADPGLTREMLHLQMALSALERSDQDYATHHMDHFLALSAGDNADEAENVRAIMAEGRSDEAMTRLESMIESMAGAMPGTDMDGDPGGEPQLEVDREVTMVMTEFAFDPTEIRATVGERVRLVAVNRGAVLHDITTEAFAGDVETTSGAAEHVSTGGADHGAADSFHVALNTGETVELVFEATEAGEYELFCSVPGHRQLGMTARLIVE